MFALIFSVASTAAAIESRDHIQQFMRELVACRLEDYVSPSGAYVCVCARAPLMHAPALHRRIYLAPSAHQGAAATVHSSLSSKKEAACDSVQKGRSL